MSKKSLRRRKPVEVDSPVVVSPGEDCLREAEICCQQARNAARMKRLGAAIGLFSTAQSLLKCAMEKGEAVLRSEAAERLAQINLESAAYAELNRKRSHSSQQPVPIPVRTNPYIVERRK